MVRTRYAPSPTGYMHIGNLRTALYGYLFARKNNGTFILRVEDTDQGRYVSDALDVIFRTLEETGINYDEGPDKDGGFGPYIQSQRKDIYLKYAHELVEKGAAYYCFCSEEELEQRRQEAEAVGKVYKYDKHCMNIPLQQAKEMAKTQPHVIRLNMPTSGDIHFTDAIFGDMTVDAGTLDDFILIKSDGLPTYNFANVIDDHLMNITHVFRGSEYLSSAPKYTVIYKAFGWEEPAYVHLPLIMKDAHNKLSKRNGDASYEDLRKKGYLMEAIINYIALLGWSPGTNQEIFSREELIQAFDIKGISKSPALFDPLKLRWMNGEYIKALPLERFHEMALAWYDQSVAKNRYDYFKISQILHTRTEVFSDIPQMIEFLPQVAPHDKTLYEHKKYKLDTALSANILLKLRDALAQLKDFNVETVKEAVNQLVQDSGLKTGQVYWPFRVALTGLASNPGGAAELADIIGREETLKRIQQALDLLNN